MQLKIEHIAKRLPYGMKYVNGWGDIKTLKYTNLDDENNGFITMVKPILFPLSALTQEITVNGNTFVPIDVINNSMSVRLMKGMFTNGNTGVYNNTTNSSNIRFWENCIIEKLISWHIDTDNLIDKSLAISVFDLHKNPYE